MDHVDGDASSVDLAYPSAGCTVCPDPCQAETATVASPNQTLKNQTTNNGYFFKFYQFITKCSNEMNFSPKNFIGCFFFLSLNVIMFLSVKFLIGYFLWLNLLLFTVILKSLLLGTLTYKNQIINVRIEDFKWPQKCGFHLKEHIVRDLMYVIARQHEYWILQKIIEIDPKQQSNKSIEKKKARVFVGYKQHQKPNRSICSEWANQRAVVELDAFKWKINCSLLL